MNVSRRDPFSLLDMLHRDFDQIAGRRYGVNNAEDREYNIADWVPAVDIIEEADRFVLRADLPGVNPDDIDVNMENGILSIAGQRHQESMSNTDGVRRVERRVGKFFRRFSMPDSANPEQVTAKSANGILEVVVPKAPDVQSRRITVESA